MLMSGIPGQTRISTPSDYDIRREGSIPKVLQIMVVLVSAVSLISLVVGYISAQSTDAANYKFNLFSLFSLLSSASLLVALYLVVRVKRHSVMLTWLSLLLVNLFIWSTAEFILRISANVSTALVWAPISTMGSALIPPTLYMFTLTYTQSKRAESPATFISIFTVSSILLYVDTKTNLLDVFSPDRMLLHPWGYAPETGSLYWVFILWFMLVGLAALIQMISFYRRTDEPAMRRQARIISIAVAIPLIGGGFTDGLLPSLHIYSFPPSASFLTTVMGLAISYGVVRYRYFSFNPGSMASQILSTMNEAVVGVASNFKISYVNHGAERMLGYTANQFFSMYFDGLFAQRLQLSEIEALFGSALAHDGHGTINSVDFRKADGSYVTVTLSVTKVIDEGQPYGYLVVMTDITPIAQAKMMIERKVAEQTLAVRETKAQLVGSINSLVFGFMITDQFATVVMVNDVAHRLFCGSGDHSAVSCREVTLEHIESEHISGVHLSDAVRACIMSRQPQTIKSVVFNNRNWRVYVSPVVDGDAVTGTAVIVQDVTEENILARSRDEFFSIASHELRTPLTAIKGNASLMLQYYADDLKDPSLRGMVDDIHESSERLIEIVNDFLEVSRLEQGRISFQLEPVSVVKAAERVVYDMGSTAKQSGVHIRLGKGLKHIDSVPDVMADPARLKQILYNLVGNAIKFTKHGSVTIDAEVSKANLKISVQDTGKGISPEMQTLLFHKFQQAGESILTRDSTKGTGLGLYISRLLARGMDGQLVLGESEVGKGSTFVLTLPLVTPERLKDLEKKAIEAENDTPEDANADKS